MNNRTLFAAVSITAVAGAVTALLVPLGRQTPGVPMNRLDRGMAKPAENVASTPKMIESAPDSGPMGRQDDPEPPDLSGRPLSAGNEAKVAEFIKALSGDDHATLDRAQAALGVPEAPLLVLEYRKIPQPREEERLRLMKALVDLHHQEVFDLLCETYNNAARNPASTEDAETVESAETVAVRALFKKWGGPSHSRTCRELTSDIAEQDLPETMRRTIANQRAGLDFKTPLLSSPAFHK